MLGSWEEGNGSWNPDSRETRVKLGEAPRLTPSPSTMTHLLCASVSPSVPWGRLDHRGLLGPFDSGFRWFSVHWEGRLGVVGSPV